MWKKLVDRFNLLFNIPPEKKAEPPKIEQFFGHKNAFTDPDALDVSYLAYKDKVCFYEKKLLYTDEPIARCYLEYQLACMHLHHRKYDVAKQLGFQIVQKAKRDGNYVWMFLGYISEIRAEIAQCKYHKTLNRLQKLKSNYSTYDEFTRHFIDVALIVNEDLMEEESQTKN